MSTNIKISNVTSITWEHLCALESLASSLSMSILLYSPLFQAFSTEQATLGISARKINLLLMYVRHSYRSYPPILSRLIYSSKTPKMQPSLCYSMIQKMPDCLRMHRRINSRETFIKERKLEQSKWTSEGVLWTLQPISVDEQERRIEWKFDQEI